MGMINILFIFIHAIHKKADIAIFIKVMSHEHHGFLSYQQLYCLFNSLFRLTSKKTSKLNITGFFLRGIHWLSVISLTKGISMLWHHHMQFMIQGGFDGWFPDLCATASTDPLKWRIMLSRAYFLSLARSKLRLCSANHRPGYFSNLACDWLSIVWTYSEQEIKNGSRWGILNHASITDSLYLFSFR